MFRVSCAELYEAAKRLPKRPARSGSPLGLGLRSAVCGTALEKSGCETRNFDSPGSGTHAHTDATRQKHWTLTRDTRRDRLTHYPIRDWRYCIPPRSCMCPWPCLACQLSQCLPIRIRIPRRPAGLPGRSGMNDYEETSGKTEARGAVPIGIHKATRHKRDRHAHGWTDTLHVTIGPAGNVSGVTLSAWGRPGCPVGPGWQRSCRQSPSAS